MPRVRFLVSTLCAVQPLFAQQYEVVPAAHASTDAVSYQWIAGASRPVRQQTLIGASHLTPLSGRTITAFELRRTAANEVYQGGSVSMSVRLSAAAVPPLQASNEFASNVGSAPVQVFAGVVTLPTSPPQIGPSVAWVPQNTLRIAFTTPFVYTGGPLCIDIVGTPIAGSNADWWMADAMFEDIAGTTLDLGGGCGTYGGPTHQWSNIARRTLLPGAYARFFAYGPPMSFGVAAFGTRASTPIPLSLLGFNSGSGCNLMLGSLDALLLSVFEPETHPGLTARGGVADIRIKIPADPAVFGATMTTQWLEWSQMATSNAIEWSVASAMPALDMALLEGHPQEATGELTVHLAHVVRLEWQ